MYPSGSGFKMIRVYDGSVLPDILCSIWDEGRIQIQITEAHSEKIYILICVGYCWGCVWCCYRKECSVAVTRNLNWNWSR